MFEEMSYVYSPRNFLLTVCAVPFLILAYYITEPGWVKAADLAYLSAEFNKPEFKLNVLFGVELLAWAIVILTHSLLLSVAASNRLYQRELPSLSQEKKHKTNRLEKKLTKFQWILIDVSIAAGVLSYHSSLIIFGGEPPFPRAMLAVFSLIMFRQITLSIFFAGSYVLPELLQRVGSEDAPDNFFNFGRFVRRRTALMVTFLFLVAVSLVVWSPSLLPVGLSPQYIAIGIAMIVALPSVVLSFYVQMRLVTVFDDCLDPLEREISKLTNNAAANKDEVDRIASLVEVRTELRKVAHLPWLTVAFSFLQVIVAIATILSVFK